MTMLTRDQYIKEADKKLAVLVQLSNQTSTNEATTEISLLVNDFIRFLLDNMISADPINKDVIAKCSKIPYPMDECQFNEFPVYYLRQLMHVHKCNFRILLVPNFQAFTSIFKKYLQVD